MRAYTERELLEYMWDNDYLTPEQWDRLMELRAKDSSQEPEPSPASEPHTDEAIKDRKSLAEDK